MSEISPQHENPYQGLPEPFDERLRRSPQDSELSDFADDAYLQGIAAAHRMINQETEQEIKDLRQELKIDKKTGLLNQEAWLNDMRRTLENLGPHDQLAVVMSDLDGFKAVNDALGHDAGDELLGLVGQAFQEVFRRDTDAVSHGSREGFNDESIARLGGDEFAASVLLPATTNNDEKRETDAQINIQLQIERVKSTLDALLANTRFAEFTIGLSIGYTIHNSEDGRESAESLFAKADHDMFRVKYQNKIENLTDEDKSQIRKIIPYLESINARVEPWLKQAVA